MKIRLTYYFLFFLLATGCKEKFLIPQVDTNRNLLVVDGMIANGGTSTIILSRTRAVNSTEALRYETSAIVTLLPATGNAMTFQNAGTGRYTLNTNSLNPNINYRLQIKTSGKEYVSDLFPVKQTPPVDSVGYKIKSNGVQLYANTHDATGKTRFYKWQFIETWQYAAKYQSFYEYKGGNTLLYRDSMHNIHSCWQTVNSSEIAVNTSKDLAQDVIHEAPLIFIEDTSARVMIRYSVLVQQYGITEDAYEFWQRMKKNTETLGSFFDAQPTEINGNIHCVSNPAEPVIGFIGAANVQEKRIFIERKDLPVNFKFLFPGCQPDTAPKGSNLNQLFGDGKNIPLTIIPIDNGYVYVVKECADCRTKGGVTQKPPFW